MEIIYSEHLKKRLELRKIGEDLPRRIFEQSDERYFDAATGHSIAIMVVELYEKNREVMLAYAIEENCAKLLTMHPLKEKQKEARISSKRWRKA
jgi:hypothetical protein